MSETTAGPAFVNQWGPARWFIPHINALEVGQSFFIPSVRASSLGGCLYNKRDKLFTTKRSRENGINGTTVIRLE